MKRRLFALVLAVCMAATLLPFTALADRAMFTDVFPYTYYSSASSECDSELFSPGTYKEYTFTVTPAPPQGEWAGIYIYGGSGYEPYHGTWDMGSNTFTVTLDPGVTYVWRHSAGSGAKYTVSAGADDGQKAPDQDYVYFQSGGAEFQVYNLNRTGLGMVRNVDGRDMTEVEIPAQVEGLPIISVAPQLFAGCTKLERVTLPDGLQIIGKEAFRDCVSLKEIVLPETITTIEEGAFSGCTALEAVKLPNGLTDMGNSVFANCSALKTANIPGGLKTVPYRTFMNSGVTSVTVGEGVTYMAQSAFEGSKLREITLPYTLSDMSFGVFMDCAELEKVTFLGNITNIQNDTFKNCSALKEICLPASLTRIAPGALTGCGRFTDVYFTGTEEQWKAVSIYATDRELLETGEMHYNFEIPAPETPFTDIASSPFKDAIAYSYARGIMNGVSDSTFDPEGTLTRGMLATCVYRHAGSPSYSKNSTFTDVDAGEWYGDPVYWAASNEIVTGYGNGLFGPGDPLTREQMALILCRYAGTLGKDTSAGADLTAFSDSADVDGWAAEAVAWAVQSGVLNLRTADRLDPTEYATRGEVAYAIMMLGNI